MSAKLECRMDIPGAQALDSFLVEPVERSRREMESRVAEFWTWAEADSSDARAIFLCAIDSIMENDEDFRYFWTSLLLGASDGKLPEFKEHMEKFIWSSVENNEDTWL